MPAVTAPVRNNVSNFFNTSSQMIFAGRPYFLTMYHVPIIGLHILLSIALISCVFYLGNAFMCSVSNFAERNKEEKDPKPCPLCNQTTPMCTHGVPIDGCSNCRCHQGFDGYFCECKPFIFSIAKTLEAFSRSLNDVDDSTMEVQKCDCNDNAMP